MPPNCLGFWVELLEYLGLGSWEQMMFLYRIELVNKFCLQPAVVILYKCSQYRAIYICIVCSLLFAAAHELHGMVTGLEDTQSRSTIQTNLAASSSANDPPQSACTDWPTRTATLTLRWACTDPSTTFRCKYRRACGSCDLIEAHTGCFSLGEQRCQSNAAAPDASYS
jgi:hypothetical protein